MMNYIFDINGDYKTQFETYVNTLIIAHRDSHSEAISNREVRAEEIKSLTDAYVGTIGERPDRFQLERLTDLLLYEELHDDTAWKTRQSDYPFLSETQYKRRKHGVHQAKKEAGNREISLKHAYSTIGLGGIDHRIPKRRERSVNENLLIDYNTRSRNKRRHKVYREFTKVQPVRRYFIGDTNNDA
ncbi:hypothetical protein [Bacillus cytotoxicus]|uniref:hypothetical protein n=1 Tax=Bacillus cytotoxicus TaxID=580165 RepID=UPI003D7EF152